MNLSIEIIREGIVEKMILLKPGEYVLGRKDSCDIVLDDNSISKNHARLSVLEDSVNIRDLGSTNGLYLDNERIEEKSFDSDFELKVGRYLLKGKTGVMDEAGTAPGLKKGLSIKWAAPNNIKLILFPSLILIALLSFFLINLSIESQVKKTQKNEYIKKGIMLARYLSEINIYFLEHGQHDQIRTTPITLEEGVTFSYVVDSTRKVVAPVSDIGKFVDKPELIKAMNTGEFVIADDRGKRKIIYYPVNGVKSTLGAVILGYSMPEFYIEKGNIILVLLFLIVFCGVLGMFLMKSFLSPIKRLEEEIIIAIKDGKNLEFQPPYKEIGDLAGAFDRLIKRASAPAGPATDVPPVEKTDLSILEGLTSPWIIVDTDQFVINRFDPSIDIYIKGTEIKKDQHIVEAFSAYPEVINAISELIDNPEKEASIGVKTDVPIVIKKVPNENEKKERILFVFENPSD